MEEQPGRGALVASVERALPRSCEPIPARSASGPRRRTARATRRGPPRKSVVRRVADQQVAEPKPVVELDEVVGYHFEQALLLEARRRLEEAEDHIGLAYVWSALGYGVANGRGRTDDWAAASEQWLPPRPARRSQGPRPYDRSRCRPVPWIAPGGRRARRLWSDCSQRWGARGLLLSRAWLLAMLDRGEGGPARCPTRPTRGSASRAVTRWPEWHLAEISSLAGGHAGAGGTGATG